MSPLDKQGASEESWCHAQTNPRSCFWWIMTRLLGRCDSTPGDVSGDTGTFSESRRKSPAFKSDSFCRQYLKTKILRARPCRFIKALLAGSAARKSGGGITERVSSSGIVNTSFEVSFSPPRIICTVSAPLTVWRWLQRYSATERSQGANGWHQCDVVCDEVSAHALHKWNNSLY